MMLGDDIAWALPELRAAAESNMTDFCIITRPDPDAPAPVLGSDGTYPPVARVTVYSGKCRVQIKAVIASASDSTAGERVATVQDFELQLPVGGTENVAVHDVAKITSSVHDGALVDREFTVDARHEKSQATARRLRVTEVTA